MAIISADLIKHMDLSCSKVDSRGDALNLSQFYKGGCVRCCCGFELAKTINVKRQIDSLSVRAISILGQTWRIMYYDSIINILDSSYIYRD